MSISQRLILVLATAFTALVFVGGIGLWRLHEAQQRFEYVQTDTLPSIKELGAIKLDASGFGRLDYRYLISTDSASKAAVKQEADALDQSLDKHIATYERDDISDDTDRQMLETDKKNLAVYRAAIASFRRGRELTIGTVPRPC